MISVLGGGVAGAALARALAARGRRDVVVHDPRPLGFGSTGRALGGFRTQHGSALNVELALASRPFFAARAERIRFRSVGYLYLAENEDAAFELERRARLQAGLGLPIEHPEPRLLAPFLASEDVLGTNYCSLDGVYIPRLILEALVEEATELGATFRYESPPPPAALEAEIVVIAAGIWSPGVARGLGVSLQVQPVERAIFQVGPFAWLSEDMPLILEAGSGFHFRERDGRLLVMFPGDQSDWGSVRTRLARRVPAADAEAPETSWSGHYEVSFDHHGLVGATERPGVWADCGFSGHGVMQAPAVGESLAAMIVGDSPPIDIRALSPLRTDALVDMTQL